MEPYSPLSNEDLESLARATIANQVVHSMFMPDGVDPWISFTAFKLFLSEEMRQWCLENEIVNVYEHVDQAGPRSVNGYPMFMSFKLMNLADAERLRARCIEIDDLLNASAPKNEPCPAH